MQTGIIIDSEEAARLSLRSQAGNLISQAAGMLAPPPPLTGSEWADQFFYVASGPYPGKWKTKRTPYLKEPLDCITDTSIELLVIEKPTRVGGTALINIAIGNKIHYDPSPILYAQTSLDEGRKYSDTIFGPFVEATPVLRERIEIERGRKSAATKLYKSFPGGWLAIIGAKSAKGFRMVGVPLAIGDDVDGWEKGYTEGDRVLLLKGRTKDFWNGKTILVSSPTTEDVSSIHNQYEQTDQRERYVPCPHCDTFQILKFGNKDTDYGIKWKSANDDVWYLCENCHKEIHEFQKLEMDTRGIYKPKSEFTGRVGFKLSPFLCSWHPWNSIRNDFIGTEDNPHKMMVFVNQTLGDVYKEDQSGRVTEKELLSRRENYTTEVPKGVSVLTAGVDVQDDRLEVEIIGWGPGEESWGIEEKIIKGSPVEQDVWDELDKILIHKKYRHESGELLNIKASGVDIGGHYTTQVHEYTSNREVFGIVGVQGSKNEKADILYGDITRNNSKNAPLQKVGVTVAKDLIYARLKIKKHGPGYVHLPMHYDAEFVDQLLSEKLIVTKTGKRQYVPIPGRRNEALDRRNYALAALYKFLKDGGTLDKIDNTPIANRAYYKFVTTKHLDENVTLKPQYPIIVCCDFNNPMVWPLAQTDGKKVWVFDEIAIRNTHATDMCSEVLRRYGNHNKKYIIYGSAMGSVRSSADKSQYAFLKDMGFVKQRYHRTNAPIVDRVNAIQNMLENPAGNVNLKIKGSTCINLKKDLEQLQWKDGEIHEIDFWHGAATKALGFFIEYEWPLRQYKPNTNKAFYK